MTPKDTTKELTDEESLREQRREADREDAPMLARMLTQYELEQAGALQPDEYVDATVTDESGKLLIRIRRDVADW